MKNNMMTRLRLVSVAVALFGCALNSSAVQGVQLSFQGSDVVLRWPSLPPQTFIIGYKPDLDATTSWTYLNTSLAAAAGGETTFTHVGAFQGGGGQLMALAGEGSSATSAKVVLSKEEIEARRAATREAANKAFAVLMAQFEAAIAKAKAMMIQRRVLIDPGKTLTAENGAGLEEGFALAGGTEGGQNLAAQQSVAGQGFYIVLEYAEDSDNDGLPNRIELEAGLNFLNTDSDGDLIADGAEDTDGDGVNNNDEALSGTLVQEPDSEYPPPPLPFGTEFYMDETFTIAAGPDSGFAPAAGAPAVGTQELLFLDGSPDMAHGLTVTENSPSEVRVRLHSIYIGSVFGAFLPTNANPPQNPFPRPTDAEMALLHAANGETDIGSGRIGQIRQDLYDQLPEHVLDWANWQAEYGLRKTERLIQEIESGQRQASAALRRALRANLVTQAKRLGAATSSLFRRFGRAVGRYLPFIGGIMILAGASAIAEQWNTAFENYAADIHNSDDTTGSVAILAALSNDLSPGSGNIVLNALLR